MATKVAAAVGGGGVAKASPATRRLFPIVRSCEGASGLPAAGPTISIAQFNILGSNLASPTHFPYVKPEHLAWKRRKHTLLNEIKQLSTAPRADSSTSSTSTSSLADVLCFQELTDYWAFFQRELAQLGYASVYVKRPSLHGTSWSGVEKKDGCGIFFKGDRFKLVMERSINFKDQHDRVALMVLLEDRNGASSTGTGGKLHDEGEKRKRDLVLVTTTHLYWDSTKIDDQMKELREVGEGIEEMRLLVEREFKQSELPIFFCGDFNNSPQSPIYSYMRDEIGVRADPRSSTRMRSAYDVYGSLQPDQGRILLPAEGNAAGPQQEPTHTTVTSRRCWTIDYIWYNPASLRPTHLLEVPEEEALRTEAGPEGWVERENERRLSEARVRGLNEAEVALLQTDAEGARKYNGLPNPDFGSDHLPLMAVFEIVPNHQ